jgi:hypothetical protein
MSEIDHVDYIEFESQWRIGFKKYGNTIVRFCTETMVDPNVLIEKYALENSWFYKLVINDDINQHRLNFGLEFLEDRTFTNKDLRQSVYHNLIANNLCSILEPVALISCNEKSTTNKTSLQPDPKISGYQLSLF